MVPAFRFFFKEMDQKAAVATSLAAIVLTAIATTAKNHTNGLIDWRVALVCGLAGGIVGWFAADLLKKLSDEMLVRIFATTIILFGVQMWVQSIKKQNLLKANAALISVDKQKN